MDGPEKYLVSKRATVLEMTVFILLIALVWLDELLDIPYQVLHPQEDRNRFQSRNLPGLHQEIIPGTLCATYEGE